MTTNEIAALARWVGALEVDDEYTLTLEQLERLARLIATRLGNANA
jgi:hypothetical protein